MSERFVQHPIYKNYLVGEYGTIYSLITHRAMHPAPNKSGYMIISVTISKGKRISAYVHVLVGQCWVGGYFDGAEIDHKNTIKSDNKASNLQWVTRMQNMHNPLTFGKTYRGGNTHGKPVIDSKGNRFKSIAEAARFYNVDKWYLCALTRQGKAHSKVGILNYAEE